MVQYPFTLWFFSTSIFEHYQKLSFTFRKAERVLVLAEEGIAEEGTHEELLEKKGAYEALYNLQFR